MGGSITVSASEAEAASVTERVETIAQDVVMLDRRQLPALAKMAKALKELGRAVEATDHAERTRCAAAASAAATLLERIILAESAAPDQDLQLVCQTVASLQAILCLAHAADFPTETAGLGGGTPGGGAAPGAPAAAESGRVAGLAVSPLMDDDLFNAFIAQQQSVLPEIDDAILAFEKDGLATHLAALRRIIHTMKGESGVCGVTDIAQVCHKLEDYLDCQSEAAQHSVSADLLFAAKDWLERAVMAYAQGVPPTGMEALLARLARPRVAATPPEPAADSRRAVARQTVPIGDRELAADFVGEAQEHFDAADENLMRLESEPANKDAIGAVFRAFHTIKGVSGFIGLAPIGELAHAAESLLDDVRKDRNVFSGLVAEVTFRALDMLKQMMGDLGKALQAGTDLSVTVDLPVMIGELHRIRESGGVAQPQPITVRSAPRPERRAQPEPPPVEGGGEHAPEEAPESESGRSAPGGALPLADAKAPTLVKPSMKVDAEKIDNLLDMIGELVITESMVINNPAIKELRCRSLERDLTLLTKITRQLQDMSMSMRLIPVDATFKKMARLIRDLSKKSGKQITLHMEGSETEIDKSIVDKLGDPLVHMIRNSADHGIESTADRLAAGKDPTGNITLKAFHQGGSVCIQIVDDGRGLSRSAILAKAIEKGMLTDGSDMSDQEVFSLIFEAGFSTAKVVTDVSGRGVGMDVVKRNIDSLRGKVLIESRPGRGTTFTLVLPLTTAIIDGMLTQVGEETYILPTLSIVQSFQPKAEQIATVTGRGKVVEFRGNLLPIYELAKIFNLPSANRRMEESVVVVVEWESRQIAFLVDRLLGQSQTVIKSMSDSLGVVPGISGASIMADGKPGMILDVGGIVALAEAD
jgi:two-component system chemotaxis sensor kinase CheA